MDRPDIPLNALRVFEVAARQGSFTRAAIELRVTQAAISHQISKLEDLLGVVLFLRTPRGLVLTDEGTAILPSLERSLDDISRTLDRLNTGHDIEILNVGVVTTFATGWLIRRLPQFQRDYPNITLRISTNNNQVQIAKEGLDMAIRFGDGRWPGVEAIPLISASMSPLCAPHLAASVSAPDDLRQQVLFRTYRSDEWPLWFDAAGVACPTLDGPVFDSSIAIANLAAEGLGVALLPVEMFERLIVEHRLVRPFSTSVSTGKYWLTHPSDREQRTAELVFADWLTGQLRSSRSES